MDQGFMVPISRLARRKITTIVGGLFLIWLLYKIFDSSNINLDDLRDDRYIRGHSTSKHDKWIVLTTIQAPTEQVKQMANIPGWQMVVIGDRKTPANWHVEGAVFLDIQAQKKMKFSIASVLPYDSYTRKMLGYLYAIEHGARYIYETDDDNVVMDDLLSFHYSKSMDGLLLHTNNITANPYVHFGQSTLWPRGYPLEFVGNDPTRKYTRCQFHAPAIQQGLVNGDPDVDAMFRLTRKHQGKALQLSFDERSPPLVLPDGVYAPFNAQNTLFTYDAFWALFLPTTVPAKNCDIYRSYFAQRLLSISGHTLSFFPPRCVQVRNFHSYIKDAMQESTMYTDMGRLIHTVKEWRCGNVHFFNCISDLAAVLVKKDFLQTRDVDLINDWLADLASIGYIPPPMKGKPRLCTDDPMTVTFYPSEQNTSSLHTTQNSILPGTNNHAKIEAYIQSTCKSEQKLPPFTPATADPVRNGLVLVVLVRELSTLPFLEAMYKPHFPHILYCGNTISERNHIIEKWQVSYVSLKEPSPFTCVMEGIRMGYKAEGFLYASDNTLVNPKLIKKHYANNLWMTRNIFVYQPDIAGDCRLGVIACQSITKEQFKLVGDVMMNIRLDPTYNSRMGSCLKKIASDPSIEAKATYLTDMVFHIPQRFTELYQQLVQGLGSNSQTKSLLVVSVLFMECLELGPDYMEFKPFQADTKAFGDVDYIFPYPITHIPRKSGDLYNHYCSNVFHTD